jgi:glycosyltransferase 2 family protein
MSERLHLGSASMHLSPGMIHGIVLFVSAGALLYLSGILWAGRAETLASMSRIGLPALVLFAGIAATSFLWRFVRWVICLGLLGYRLPIGFNLLVYLSGLALTTSPGKLGETFRSVILAGRGVRVPHSLGAFLADRLSDVLGVCMLGIAAGLLAGGSWPWLLGAVFVGLLGLSSLFAGVIRHRSAGHFWALLAERIVWLPVRGGQATLEAWAELWFVRRALGFSLFAILAYGTQASVFVLICHRVGIEIEMPAGILVFVNATLFGAASLVPGGLGTMEAALVFQLLQHGATEQSAVSIAVATRLVTLWMGIGVGVSSLFLVAGRR